MFFESKMACSASESVLSAKLLKRVLPVVAGMIFGSSALAQSISGVSPISIPMVVAPSAISYIPGVTGGFSSPLSGGLSLAFPSGVSSVGGSPSGLSSSGSLSGLPFASFSPASGMTYPLTTVPLLPQAVLDGNQRAGINLAQLANSTGAGMAEAKFETRVIQNTSGQFLYYTYLRAAPGKPTFVLMPGVNRGLVSGDQVLVEFQTAGVGFVAPQLSVHPLSVNQIPDEELVKFSKDYWPTTPDFAREIELVGADFTSLTGTPIDAYVSLSHTGSLVRHLHVAHVIDTVPMASARATYATGYDPENMVQSARHNCELTLLVWKFSGIYQSIVDACASSAASAIDTSARSSFAANLAPQVAHQLMTTPELKKDRQVVFVNGLVKLVTAVQNYDWNDPAELPLAASPKRDFLLAASEGPKLLRSQLELFKAYREIDPEAQLLVADKSGHILPSDQPKSFLLGLLYFQSAKTLSHGSVGALKAEGEGIAWLNEEDAEKFVNQFARH